MTAMIDSKSFIIVDKPVEKTNYKVLQLNNRMYVNYEKSLTVHCSPNKNLVILGDVWSGTRELSSIEEVFRDGFLLADDIERLTEIEANLCGRYVIIFNGEVYLDATGMMPIFFGENVVSNSLHVLAEYLHITPEHLNTQYAVGMDYFPGSLTFSKKIRRLLPSQILRLDSQSVRSRQLLDNKRYEHYSKKDIATVFDDFIEDYKQNVRNMRNAVEGDYFLGVTAGKDSRATLALFENAGIEYQAVSFLYEKITKPDRVIPFALCKCVEKNLYQIPDKDADDGKYQNYMTHTVGYGKCMIPIRYAKGQYDELQKLSGSRKSVQVLGGVWELTSFYMSYLGEHPDYATVKNCYGNVAANKLFIDSLNEFFSWEKKSPQTNLDDNDRFCWEIFFGGWLSSIMQGTDIIDGWTIVQPLNCRALITMLMALPKEVRRKKNHEKIIANMLVPNFKEIPYEDDFFVADERNILLPKMREFYHVLTMWLDLRLRGITIVDWLKQKGYDKVAIFGMKELGALLAKELTSAHVEYGIDAVVKENKDLPDLQIVTLQNISDTVRIDAVIVTAIHYYDDIFADVWLKTRVPVISLSMIIEDLHKNQ